MCSCRSLNAVFTVTLWLSAAMACQSAPSSYNASSKFWQIQIDNGSITSLRYDAAGKSAFSQELVFQPLSATINGSSVDITASAVTFKNNGRELTLSLASPKSDKAVLSWPIKMGVDGYFDRLTGKSLKNTTSDDPALLRFIAARTGHTIMVESFKRVNVESLNSGSRDSLNLANSGGSTVVVQTRNLQQFIVDYGRNGQMKFGYNKGWLMCSIHPNANTIVLRASASNGGIRLERGEQLPYFTFGNNSTINTSTGGQASLNGLYNDFYQQSAFWFPYGAGHTVWGAWGAQGHAYVNSSYREDVRRNLSKQTISDDGYGHDGLCYAWGDERGWPFPGGVDTRQFYVGANQICAIAHYLAWTGEYDRLKKRDFSFRLYDGKKLTLAQDISETQTRLMPQQKYTQSFRSGQPFSSIAFNLMVQTVDAVMAQDGVDIVKYDRGPADATPMKDIPGQCAAQVIKPSKPFNTVGLRVATYSSAGNGGRLRAYSWLGDYEKSLNQTPLFEQVIKQFNDCQYIFVPLKETQPAGTQILVVLDKPTQQTPGQTCMSAYFFFHKTDSPDLGAMYVNGELQQNLSMDAVYGTRFYPGTTVELTDSKGQVLYSKYRDVQSSSAYWSVDLDKRYPAGSYTVTLIPNGAVMYWLGSTMDAGIDGEAFMNGHSWDPLDRARRMMNYQLEYLHVRKEGVPLYDGYAGDKDHLGLPVKSVGSNYYDILPFGYYDAYGAVWSYQAIKAMADMERSYGMAAKSTDYRALEVKTKARFNQLYWSNQTKDGASRYISCIDSEGTPHDYGFTVLNTMAVDFGLASKSRALSILNWLDRGRTRDRSGQWKDDDVYFWQFAPRVTTLDNVDWWALGQKASDFPWGDQIQNGGADLYESYYDLMARLKTKGADDAYSRFLAIIRRYAEPDRLTGYSPLYTGGSVQGGQAGGVGIMTSEFPETSLLASFVLYGFLGANAQLDGLHLHPLLPSQQPYIKGQNIYYHGTYFDITATHKDVTITTQPVERRYDFIINGKKLVAPFTYKAKLPYSGELLIKPVLRK